MRLLAPVDGWPAGTTGTVLLAYRAGCVVEIDANPDVLTEIEVDNVDIEVIWSAEEKSLAAQA